MQKYEPKSDTQFNRTKDNFEISSKENRQTLNLKKFWPTEKTPNNKIRKKVPKLGNWAVAAAVYQH